MTDPTAFRMSELMRGRHCCRNSPRPLCDRLAPRAGRQLPAFPERRQPASGQTLTSHGSFLSREVATTMAELLSGGAGQERAAMKALLSCAMQRAGGDDPQRHAHASRLSCREVQAHTSPDEIA